MIGICSSGQSTRRQVCLSNGTVTGFDPVERHGRQIKHQIEHQVEHQVEHEVEHEVDLSEVFIAVLRVLGGKMLSRKEIFASIGMNGDSRSFKRNIEPLITGGFVEMTVPDKSNSKLQKYRLTDKGIAAGCGNRIR